MINDNIFKLLSKKRNAIMGIATISVLFFHHVFYQMFNDGTTLRKIGLFFIENGNLGVDYFFFLSGFGLLYSIENNSVKKFYYNRLKKIIIPYTFSVVVYALNEEITLLNAIKGYIGYSFIFENAYATPWFIPAIVIIYLFFPLYYKFFKKQNNKCFFTICFLIVWLLLSILFNNLIRSDLYGLITRVPLFLVGVLFGYYSKYGYSNGKNIKITNIFIIVSSVIMLVASIYFLYLNDCDDIILPVLLTKYYLPSIVLVISSSIVYVIIFSNKNGFISRINDFFSFVGNYSLEIYCLEDFSKNYIYILCPYISNCFIKNIIIFIEILISVYIFKYINNIIIKKIETKLNV